MSNTPRMYLCQGCFKAPAEGVVNGEINCKAAGKVVPAEQYTEGKKYESCQHRSSQQVAAKGKYLLELAKGCRELGQSSGPEVDKLVSHLKKKYGVD